MINSNVNTSASTMSAQNSSVVSSSKSAASAAPSSKDTNSAAKTSAKVAPREILPLKDRTSVKNLRDGSVQILNITEKTGSKVQVYLVAPRYKVAESINDARQALTFSHGMNMMIMTTPRYQDQLFRIMRNLEVDGKPAKMGWDFADKHIEAFNWITRKADSFLRNYFNPSEQ